MPWIAGEANPHCDECRREIEQTDHTVLIPGRDMKRILRGEKPIGFAGGRFICRECRKPMSCYRCGHVADRHGALPPGCVERDSAGQMCQCPRSCFDVDLDDAVRRGGPDPFRVLEQLVPEAEPSQPRPARAYPQAYVICRGCQRLLSENTPLPSRSTGDNSSLVVIGFGLCEECNAKGQVEP